MGVLKQNVLNIGDHQSLSSSLSQSFLTVESEKVQSDSDEYDHEGNVQ